MGVGTSTIHLCSIKSSLPSLYPLHHSRERKINTHVINYSRLSPTFPYCKQWKAGQGLGTRLDLRLVCYSTQYITESLFYSLGQCRHPLGPSSSSSVCTFKTRLHSGAVITGPYMIIQHTSFPKVTQVV